MPKFKLKIGYKKIKVGLEFEKFVISIKDIDKSYNKVSLTINRGKTQRTFEITGDGILSPSVTQCRFEDVF